MAPVMPMKIGMSPSGSTTAKRETKQSSPNAATSFMRVVLEVGVLSIERGGAASECEHRDWASRLERQARQRPGDGKNDRGSPVKVALPL